MADAVGTDLFWIVPERGSLERVLSGTAAIVGGSAPATGTGDDLSRHPTRAVGAH
ncbi:hypothetical protein ACSS7Z_08325 [Microbacterium sp. A82]